jgi:hypothetical protein
MTKTTFCEEAMSHMQVFDGFCLFKDGHTSIESDEHSDVLHQAEVINS